MTTAVFPRQCESVIDKEELKVRISIEDEINSQGHVMVGFLNQFIDKVSREAKVGYYLCYVFFSFLNAGFAFHSSNTVEEINYRSMFHFMM